jgi:hypothetical protein
MLERLNDYDWENVFGEGDCGCDVEAVGSCAIEPKPNREDVTEILAIQNGERDGANWIGVFKLKDGRYVYATGGCDYTGWD